MKKIHIIMFSKCMKKAINVLMKTDRSFKKAGQFLFGSARVTFAHGSKKSRETVYYLYFL